MKDKADYDNKLYNSNYYEFNSDEFKNDIIEYYGVSDNPKVEKAFQIAHDLSCGYVELDYHFSKLIELIKS